MRVHDSQAYRKMDVKRERISRILELKKILLSIQIGFSLVNAAVACAILQSNSGLEPSSVIIEPRYLKLVTVSSFCPFTLISVLMPLGSIAGRGCSSVARASDRHAPDAGLIPRCGKGFFSQSQLSVKTLLRASVHPC